VSGVKSAYHDRAAAERGKHGAVRADLATEGASALSRSRRSEPTVGRLG
jgi:hypothetical protein